MFQKFPCGRAVFQMNNVEDYFFKKEEKKDEIQIVCFIPIILFCSFAVSHPPPLSSACGCFYIQLGGFAKQITSYYWTNGAILWLLNGLLGFFFSFAKYHRMKIATCQSLFAYKSDYI